MLDRLQKELKQNRPFDVPEIRTLVGINKTAALINDQLNAFFKSHGLSQQQYNVLRILRGAGPEGLASLEIGERMVQRVPDVTRLLDRLEAAGKVKRQRSERDRRVVHVTMTPRARRQIDEMDEPLRNFAESMLAGLTIGDLGRIDELLDRVRVSLAPEPPSADTDLRPVEKPNLDD